MEISFDEASRPVELLRIEKANDFIRAVDLQFGVVDRTATISETEKNEMLAKANDASDTIFTEMGQEIKLSPEEAKRLKVAYDSNHKPGDFEQLFGQYKTGLASEFGVIAKNEADIEKGKNAAKEIFGTRDPLIKFA